MKYRPDFHVVARYWPAIQNAFFVTIEISVVAYILAFALGFVLALMLMSRNRIFSYAGRAYAEVLRGTPELVQILWIFYVLPVTFGLRLGVMTAGIIGLAISLSAYLGEVFRAGFKAVPRGHGEAARALGMSQAHTLFRIQLPEAVPVIVPLLMSNYILLLKRTSLLTAIGAPELLFRTRSIASETFRPLEMLTVAAVLYLALVLVLSFAERRLEARVALPTR